MITVKKARTVYYEEELTEEEFVSQLSEVRWFDAEGHRGREIIGYLTDKNVMLYNVVSFLVSGKYDDNSPQIRERLVKEIKDSTHTYFNICQ